MFVLTILCVTYDLQVLNVPTLAIALLLRQVAWMKKAPPNVQKAMKPDMVLVHYFDSWADVHNTPSKWAYGWLPGIVV
jgi:hypothetical protein